MAGKKWCQYCRINISYNKKEIQEHEQTRLHLQNKQRVIKFQRMSIQRQQKQKRQLQKQNALLSTANIPKASKGSQLQKQIQQYRNEVISNGKSAIHQLIAEKTKGMYGAPIEFPNKQDLVLAENFKPDKGESDGSDSQQFQMWRIDVCEETGEPCFINNVTKAKYYQPPKGYIMTEHQKQQWQNLKQICKQKIDNADNTVNISQWQEVPQEEDYFKINQVQECDDQEQEKKSEQGPKRRHPQIKLMVDDPANQKQSQIKKSWVDELQQKINKHQVDANEVMETVIYHKLVQCKNLKQKNETLKKLIKGDIQIRHTLQEGIKKDDIFNQIKQQSVGFKSKKKIKAVKLIDESDI